MRGLSKLLLCSSLLVLFIEVQGAAKTDKVEDVIAHVVSKAPEVVVAAVVPVVNKVAKVANVVGSKAGAVTGGTAKPAPPKSTPPKQAPPTPPKSTPPKQAPPTPPKSTPTKTEPKAPEKPSPPKEEKITSLAGVGAHKLGAVGKVYTRVKDAVEGVIGGNVKAVEDYFKGWRDVVKVDVNSVGDAVEKIAKANKNQFLEGGTLFAAILTKDVDGKLKIVSSLTDGAAQLVSDKIQSAGIVLDTLVKGTVGKVASIVEGTVHSADHLKRKAGTLFGGALNAVGHIEEKAEHLVGGKLEGAEHVKESVKDTVGGAVVHGVVDFVGSVLEKPKENVGGTIHGVGNILETFAPIWRIGGVVRGVGHLAEKLVEAPKETLGVVEGVGHLLETVVEGSKGKVEEKSNIVKRDVGLLLDDMESHIVPIVHEKFEIVKNVGDVVGVIDDAGKKMASHIPPIVHGNLKIAKNVGDLANDAMKPIQYLFNPKGGAAWGREEKGEKKKKEEKGNKVGNSLLQDASHIWQPIVKSLVAHESESSHLFHPVLPVFKGPIDLAHHVKDILKIRKRDVSKKQKYWDGTKEKLAELIQDPLLKKIHELKENVEEKGEFFTGDRVQSIQKCITEIMKNSMPCKFSGLEEVYNGGNALTDLDDDSNWTDMKKQVRECFGR